MKAAPRRVVRVRVFGAPELEARVAESMVPVDRWMRRLLRVGLEVAHAGLTVEAAGIWVVAPSADPARLLTGASRPETILVPGKQPPREALLARLPPAVPTERCETRHLVPRLEAAAWAAARRVDDARFLARLRCAEGCSAVATPDRPELCPGCGGPRIRTRRGVAASTWLGCELPGGWTLVAQIGRGAQGAVFDAVGPRGERAAVKLLEVDPLSLGGQAMAKAHARREVNTLRAQGEGVPGYLDHGVTESGARFLVMERLRGRPVSHLPPFRGASKGAPLAPEEALGVVVNAARTVEALHRRGLQHRDIKPSNLFLEAGPLVDGVPAVRVLDLGLARHRRDARLPQSGQIRLGTPPYMAPELVGSERGMIAADQAADQYALGVMAYRGVAGVLPFPEEADERAFLYRVLRQPPPPLPEEVPMAQRRAILRALEKQPGARHSSVAAFARALCEPSTGFVDIPLAVTPPEPLPAVAPAPVSPAGVHASPSVAAGPASPPAVLAPVSPRALEAAGVASDRARGRLFRRLALLSLTFLLGAAEPPATQVAPGPIETTSPAASPTLVTVAEWATTHRRWPAWRLGDGPVSRVSFFEALAHTNARSRAAGLAPCYALVGCAPPGEGCGADDRACAGPGCDAVEARRAGCGFRLPTRAEAEAEGFELPVWTLDLPAGVHPVRLDALASREVVGPVRRGLRTGWPMAPSDRSAAVGMSLVRAGRPATRASGSRSSAGAASTPTRDGVGTAE